MKHVKMPKKLAEKWLKALRGGEYIQGSGHLEKNGKFCCLGVLQMCVSGHIDRIGNSEIPSKNWLKEHQITFRSLNDTCASGSCNPYLEDLGKTAAEANDWGAPFSEIADAIEKELEFTEEQRNASR